MMHGQKNIKLHHNVYELGVLKGVFILKRCAVWCRRKAHNEQLQNQYSSADTASVKKFILAQATKTQIGS